MRVEPSIKKFIYTRLYKNPLPFKDGNSTKKDFSYFMVLLAELNFSFIMWKM